jgi:hypothetical protein
MVSDVAILTNRFKWSVRKVAMLGLKTASFLVMLLPTLACVAIDKLNSLSDKFMAILDRYVSWVLSLDMVRCENCVAYDKGKAKRGEMCHVHIPTRWTLRGKEQQWRSRCLRDELYYSDMPRMCPDYMPKEGELIAVKKD